MRPAAESNALAWASVLSHERRSYESGGVSRFRSARQVRASRTL